MVLLDAKRVNDFGQHLMQFGIRDIFTSSIRAVYYNFKFVFLLWGLNAAAAFILTVPTYYILVDNLSQSMMGQKLETGLDYMWLVQFFNLYKSNIGELPLMIYGMVGIYVLVQTFFLGGLVAIFNIPKKNHMVDFFFGGVRYWYRFTKVTLVSLIFFFLAFELNYQLGNWIAWSFSGSESVLTDFVLRSLRYILLIFLIGLITLISDYSKVSVGIKDSQKVLKEIFSSILFIKQNFVKIFSVFLLVAAIGAAGGVVYNFVGAVIPRTPFYFLILSFILQQMLIIFRLLIRMLFCSTEVLLFKDLNAEIISVESN